MPKTDNVRQVDLPRSGSGGGSIYIGGSSGGVSNADTVDGYHASSVPTAGKLLALDSAAHFAASVIDWGSVAGAGLDDSGDTLVVQWGASPTTIVPDAATNGGSAATAARSDHTHAIAAAAPAANLTVVTANAEGNATSFARSNHLHAITSSANPGAAASILASDVNGYLQLTRIGLGVTPSYPLHVQGVTPQLRLQQDATHYADFEVAGDGGLTIQPSGDSLLLPSGKTLASDNWASQTTGWGIYPESTYGRDGYADFRYLYADEMHVKAFIADLEQALAGGQIISKSVAILAADFTIPAKGSAAALKVEDLPGTTAPVFESGDWIRIRNISRSGGGLIVADCYGAVGAATLNGDGTQSYTFTRPAADTGSAATGTVVTKGGLALDYGVSGDGYWEVTTLDTAGSPYAQVVTWTDHPQNLAVHARLGNLDGIAGVDHEWGLWAGKDSGRWLRLTDAGAMLRGLTQSWIDYSGNTRGGVNPDAGDEGFLFWLGPSNADPRFIVTGDGTVYIGSVPSQNIAGWAHGSDITKIDGGDIYAGSITTPQLAVVPFNELPNPSFEYGDTAPYHWNTTNAVWGAYGQNSSKGFQITGAGATVFGPRALGITGYSGYAKANSTYVLSAWMRKMDSVTGIAVLALAFYDSAGTYLTEGHAGGAGSALQTWTRYQGTIKAPANAYYYNAYLLLEDSVPSGHRVWFDDVSVREADGVGSVFGVPGGARVEINTNGIEGRDSFDNVQFQIRTSDGRGMFGDEHGVLDVSGLVLSGNDTSYNTYDGIRWMTQVDPPGGNQVARILAGRWGGLANYYELLVEANPDILAGYPSDIVIRTNTKSASDTGNGRNYIRGGLYLSSQIIQASAILSTEVDEGEGNAAIQVIGESTNSYIKFVTKDIERMRIAHDGTMTLSGILSVRNATQTLNGGVVAEADTTIIDFGMNEDSANRFGGTYTSSAQGGLFRVDTRSGYDLFTFLGRAAGSTGSMALLASIKSNAFARFYGNLGVGVDPQQKIHTDGVVRADTRFDRGTNQGFSGQYKVNKATGSVTFTFDGGILVNAVEAA